MQIGRLISHLLFLIIFQTHSLLSIIINTTCRLIRCIYCFLLVNISDTTVSIIIIKDIFYESNQ